jgi:hypothetical protein
VRPSCAARGDSDILHAELSIATRLEAHAQRPSRSIARGFEVPVAVRQFFQPCVLAVVALAVMVGGCGYGYKLSQYFQQPGVIKASPTRMWVDHRDESHTLPAQLQTKPQRIPGFALFASSAAQLPRLSRDHVVITPAPPRVAFVISSNIPFRAPPAFDPSLA